jgi:phosphoglycolate phosphatase
MPKAPKNQTPRRPLLIFDLDGTLIDSAPDIAVALNRVLASAGRDMVSFQAARAMVGQGARTLVQRGFEATGGPPADLEGETARFLTIYGRALACHTTVYDGVAQTLGMLRDSGHTLALLTNKPLAPTRAILGALDLERYFDADLVLGGDGPYPKKPDPASLHAILQFRAHAPAQAVMIGDSINDIAAAQSAGIAAIAVRYGYCDRPPEDLGADSLIARFSDLPDALEGLPPPRR